MKRSGHVAGGRAFRLFVVSVLLAGSVRGETDSRVRHALHLSGRARPYTVLSERNTTFLLSGQKMYEVACVDGSFPRESNPYEERGLWCHPVKLLSDIDYIVQEDGREAWHLNDAVCCDYDFSAVRFAFERDGLRISRQEVIAESEAALATTFCVANESGRARDLCLRLRFHTDIRPSLRCDSLRARGKSVADFSDGHTAVVYNPAGTLAIGNGQDFHAFQQEDSVVEVAYRLRVPPGEGNVRVPLLIVGSNRGEDVGTARERHGRLLAVYDDIALEKKARYEEGMYGGVSFSCSDEAVTDAFHCARANVLLNTCDHRPYLERPFIRAGVPVYPRLFGTDFCFSARGLLAGGYASPVRHTLLLMADYARLHLRAPHEVGSDGVLLGWDHIQVTPQWIAACHDYYLWTRDTAFLAEVYPLCRALLDDVLQQADSDADGFIEGRGLMEESEFKANWEELSSSAYLYAALTSLSAMAEAMGERQASRRFERRAAAYRKRFNHTWWNAGEGIWNCAFTEDGAPRAYHFWSVVFPQKTGVATAKRGTEAMMRIGRDWVNDAWGMVGRFDPERDQSQDGVGMVHNHVCASAAFDYGLGELGWKLLKLATRGVFGLSHSCLGLFPECQPGLCSNISQLWSYATFLESILTGLAGIRPDAAGEKILVRPFIPEDLTFLLVDNIKIGQERLSVKWERGADGKACIDIAFTGELSRIDVPREIRKSYPCRVTRTKRGNDD